MSKLLPFLVAAAGASTVSVGGVFMLKKGGGQGTDGGKTSPTTTQTKTANEEVKDLDGFKKDKGDKCVHDLFGSELAMTDSTSSDLPSNQNDYFGDNPTGETEGANTTGCLIINWNKTTYKDSKWKGTFTWSWSFKNQKKGFIIFGVAKTNDTSKKLQLTGVTFFLTEEDSPTKKWSIKHHKEVKDQPVELNNSDFKNKFPKVKDNVNAFTAEKDYWGFVSGESDLSNIWGTSDSTDSPNNEAPKTYKYQWDWKKDGGTQKITDWCDKTDWWGQLFSPSTFDMSTKLNSFTGTWTKQNS